MPANAVETVSAPSTADFKSLEEKILRTIELLKSAREAKAAAERDVSRLREKLNEREEEIDTMRQEMVTPAPRARRGTYPSRKDAGPN